MERARANKEEQDKLEGARADKTIKKTSVLYEIMGEKSFHDDMQFHNHIKYIVIIYKLLHILSVFLQISLQESEVDLHK